MGLTPNPSGTFDPTSPGDVAHQGDHDQLHPLLQPALDAAAGDMFRRGSGGALVAMAASVTRDHINAEHRQSLGLNATTPSTRGDASVIPVGWSLTRVTPPSADGVWHAHGTVYYLRSSGVDGSVSVHRWFAYRDFPKVEVSAWDRIAAAWVGPRLQAGIAGAVAGGYVPTWSAADDALRLVAPGAVSGSVGQTERKPLVWETVAKADGTPQTTDSDHTYERHGGWLREAGRIKENTGGQHRKAVVATGRNFGWVQGYVDLRTGMPGYSFRADGGTVQKQLAVRLNRSAGRVELMRIASSAGADQSVLKDREVTIDQTRYHLLVWNLGAKVGVWLNGALVLEHSLTADDNTLFTGAHWGLYQHAVDTGDPSFFADWSYQDVRGIDAALSGASGGGGGEVLGLNELDANDPPSAWPAGRTVMPFSRMLQYGWPGGEDGNAIVERTSDGGTVQRAELLPHNWSAASGESWRGVPAKQRTFRRHGVGDDWSEFESDDYPEADFCCSLTDTETEPLGTGVWAHVGIDGWIIGTDNGPTRVYRKANWGDPWVQVGPDLTTSKRAKTVLLTGSGELLLVLAEDGVWRSDGYDGGAGTVTGWTQVVTPTGEAFFDANAVSTRGDMILATECIRKGGTGGTLPEWEDSRYVYFSPDNGATVQVIRDTWEDLLDDPADPGSDVLTPGEQQRHHHAVCIAETPTGETLLVHSFHDHGSLVRRIEYVDVADLDGLDTPWKVLSADLMAMSADPTPYGVVFGSDDRPSGVYAAKWAAKPELMEVEYIFEIPVWAQGLVYIARHSAIDPSTGLVYMALRASIEGHGAVIVATDGLTARVVWEMLPIDHQDRIEGLGVHAGIVFAQLFPNVGDPELLRGKALPWRPGRAFFRKDGASHSWGDVYAVGLPSGDTIDLGAA